MYYYNVLFKLYNFTNQVSDERYQRVQIELKHTIEILHEEQERVIKIEAIKKSLEIEVKNISVRLEEVEANAIVGGKRIISKLEARVSTNDNEIRTSSDLITCSTRAILDVTTKPCTYCLKQIRDLELEVDEEKRRHAESVKILRKKERSLKELVIQSEEDHKNVQLLQEALDKTTQKVNIYKRQLQEQV